MNLIRFRLNCIGRASIVLFQKHYVRRCTRGITTAAFQRCAISLDELSRPSDYVLVVCIIKTNYYFSNRQEILTEFNTASERRLYRRNTSTHVFNVYKRFTVDSTTTIHSNRTQNESPFIVRCGCETFTISRSSLLVFNSPEIIVY